jgi:hypothetical protein
VVHQLKIFTIWPFEEKDFSKPKEKARDGSSKKKNGVIWKIHSKSC